MIYRIAICDDRQTDRDYLASLLNEWAAGEGGRWQFARQSVAAFCVSIEPNAGTCACIWRCCAPAVLRAGGARTAPTEAERRQAATASG